MTKKAFAIHTIMHPAEYGVGTMIVAGKVFNSNADEFTKLEKLGAVRQPTEDELALADTDTASESTGTIVTPAAAPEIPATATVIQPDSGDSNDPKSKPKGKAKKAAAAEGDGEDGGKDEEL